MTRPPWVALPLADPTEAAVYDELTRRLATWLNESRRGCLDEFVEDVLNDTAGFRTDAIVRYVLRGILANRGHAATFDLVVERMGGGKRRLKPK